jgi:hypothetical protein
MRYRTSPDPELGARVELYLRNLSHQSLRILPTLRVRFDGRSAAELLDATDWAWHDTPNAVPNGPVSVSAGGLTVWAFNSRKSAWGIGTRQVLEFGDAGAMQRLEFAIEKPSASVSAVAFLPSDESRVARMQGAPAHDGLSTLHPVRMIVRVANDTARPLRFLGVRLWIPDSNESFRALRCKSQKPEIFPTFFTG